MRAVSAVAGFLVVEDNKMCIQTVLETWLSLQSNCRQVSIVELKIIFCNEGSSVEYLITKSQIDWAQVSESDSNRSINCVHAWQWQARRGLDELPRRHWSASVLAWKQMIVIPNSFWVLTWNRHQLVLISRVLGVFRQRGAFWEWQQQLPTV